MAFSRATYTGNGTVTTFAVNFPYIAQGDVKVTLNGAAIAFTWNSPSVINITPAPVGKVELYRDTSKTNRLVDFQDDSVLNERLLDDMSTQLFYIAQEAYDEAEEAGSNSVFAIEQALEALSRANTALDASASAVATATSAFTAAAASVNASTTAVNTANAAATTANSAATDAATALSTANSAASAATTAVSTANAATTTANSADTKATTALANSAVAVSDAAAAVATANAADTKATAADTKATDALAQVEAAVSGSVVSFNGRAGAVVPQAGDYNKTQVGLANVDNTTDADKPVSNATQTALNTKANAADVADSLATKADTTTVNNALATKADVGHGHALGDLPNTVVNTTGVQTLTNKTLEGATVDGNIAISGVGRRITGDFGNATFANRPMFQSSGADQNTLISALPSGSGSISGFRAYGSSNLVNGVAALITASVSRGSIQFDSEAYGTGTHLPMTFFTGGAERMRIGVTGGVSIDAGTTPLNIRHTSSPAGRRWTPGPDSAGNFIIYNNDGVGQYMVYGATSWASSSDERLKTPLKPFENAAGKVASLRSGTGRYLTDADDVSRSFLIAQDVQAVLPEAVDVQDNEAGTLGLRYTDIIPLLVAAAQEQQAIIESQKALLETLVARIEALEASA